MSRVQQNLLFSSTYLQPIFNLLGVVMEHFKSLLLAFGKVCYAFWGFIRKIRASSFILATQFYLDATHCDRIAANTEALIAPQKPIGWSRLNEFLYTRQLDLSIEAWRHCHSLSITKQMQARISHTKSMEIEIAESAFRHVTNDVLWRMNNLL